MSTKQAVSPGQRAPKKKGKGLDAKFASATLVTGPPQQHHREADVLQAAEVIRRTRLRQMRLAVNIASLRY